MLRQVLVGRGFLHSAVSGKTPARSDSSGVGLERAWADYPGQAPGQPGLCWVERWGLPYLGIGRPLHTEYLIHPS